MISEYHSPLSTDNIPTIFDWSIAIALALLVVIAALLVILARRRAKRDAAGPDDRAVAWAMIQPVISRVKRNEEIQGTLADQVKLLSLTQSEITQGLRRQELESEKLAGYIEAALRSSSKLVDHFAALRAALSTAKTAPAAGTIRNVSPDLLPLDLPAHGIVARLTPTEFEILALLEVEGSLSAPEIGRKVRKSREHTARVLKDLFDQGYVERETGRIPFRYRLTEKVRTAMQARKSRTTITQTDSARSES